MVRGQGKKPGNGPKPQNWTGLRSNKLEAKTLAPVRKHGRIAWYCDCDCGTTGYLATIHDLRAGDVGSCGCEKSGYLRAKSIQKDTPEENAKKGCYRSVRQNAIKRCKDWELTFEQFIEITTSNCVYCNAPPAAIHTYKSAHFFAEFVHNGIDRVDSTKGYLLSNVVPCCKYCNTAKLERTKEEFYTWAERLYKHLFVKVPVNAS